MLSDKRCTLCLCRFRIAGQLHSASHASYSVIESLTVREHREKVVDAPMSAFALVARPVGIEERKRTPAAWAACEKEWVGFLSVARPQVNR